MATKPLLSWRKLNAPIVTSPGHGDAIPLGHPLNAGQMGPRGNAVASRLVKEADVILALGTRLGFNSTFYSYDNINRDAAIIQIEMEPTAIGRFFRLRLDLGQRRQRQQRLPRVAKMGEELPPMPGQPVTRMNGRPFWPSVIKMLSRLIQYSHLVCSKCFVRCFQIMPRLHLTLGHYVCKALMRFMAGQKPVFAAGFWPCWLFFCLRTGGQASRARTVGDQPDG